MVCISMMPLSWAALTASSKRVCHPGVFLILVSSSWTTGWNAARVDTVRAMVVLFYENLNGTSALSKVCYGKRKTGKATQKS